LKGAGAGAGQAYNAKEHQKATLDARPDLKASMQSIEKAKTGNRPAWANGSTDGGVSLLDFLQAQEDYGSVRVDCLNLTGAYLNGAAQMNLAAGREVIQ